MLDIVSFLSSLAITIMALAAQKKVQRVKKRSISDHEIEVAGSLKKSRQNVNRSLPTKQHEENDASDHSDAEEPFIQNSSEVSIDELVQINHDRAAKYWSRVLYVKCPVSQKGKILELGGRLRIKGRYDRGNIFDGPWIFPSRQEAQEILNKFREQKLDKNIVVDEYNPKEVGQLNLRKLKVTDLPEEANISHFASLFPSATMIQVKTEAGEKIGLVYFDCEEDGKVAFLSAENARVNGKNVVVIFDRQVLKKKKKSKNIKMDIKQKQAKKAVGFGQKSGKPNLKKERQRREEKFEQKEESDNQEDSDDSGDGSLGEDNNSDDE